MSSRTKRLTALTPDQIAHLPIVRDEWLRLGLSTARADRPRAEAAVREAYAAVKLEPPSVMVWLESPFAGAVGAAMLAQVRAQVGDQVWAQVRAQVRDQVGDQVWAQVGDQVGAQVRDQVWAQVRAQVRAQVGDQVWAQVGDQVGAQVWAQVGDQVWAQVGDQVGAQVWDQVGDQVWAQVRAQVWRSGYGQHDAGWLSFYAAFRACGLQDLVAPLTGLLELACSCGWWWPFRGAVILTERPNRLCRDAAGRLHSEDGLAIGYLDGWGVYAWHGVRVPADVILRPDMLSPERIQSETNAEIRRAMIERIGWDVWLSRSGAHPMATDRYGQLYRTELDGEPIGVCVVVNSTPESDGSFKQYAILVPPDHDTPHSAIASTFGLTAQTYAPTVET